MFLIRHRLIKMTSPKLNTLIILGGMLVYLTVALAGFDARHFNENTVTTLCQV